MNINNVEILVVRDEFVKKMLEFINSPIFEKMSCNCDEDKIFLQGALCGISLATSYATCNTNTIPVLKEVLNESRTV